MVLIDTCIWIDFLRGKSSRHVEFLEELLESGEAFLCAITYAEICFGAENDRNLKKYQTDFAQMPFLKTPENWHLNMAQMGYALKKNGYHPFVADLFIAHIAIVHQTPLLTTDKDFNPFQKLFGLQLINLVD